MTRAGRLPASPIAENPVNYDQLHSPAARTVASARRTPMSATCQRCGMRRGQHRVNDERCQNQAWRPGNGQAQWLNASFQEASHG